MRAYAVVLDELNSDVANRIEEAYPKHYKVNDMFYLVSADDIADQVAQTVGIKGDNRVEESSGVVFRLNGSYSGYTSRALWDWMELVEEKN